MRITCNLSILSMIIGITHAKIWYTRKKRMQPQAPRYPCARESSQTARALIGLQRAEDNLKTSSIANKYYQIGDFDAKYDKTPSLELCIRNRKQRFPVPSKQPGEMVGLACDRNRMVRVNYRQHQSGGVQFQPWV